MSFYRVILGAGILLAGENLLQAMEKEEEHGLMVLSLGQICEETIVKNLEFFSSSNPDFKVLLIENSMAFDSPEMNKNRQPFKSLSFNPFGEKEYFEEKEEEESLIKHSTKGNLILAQMYEKGLGVTQDLKRAFSFYRQAANEGNVDAQLRLAHIYGTGRGVEKDEQKAVELYTQAAAQGLVMAQFNLALKYANGRGVEKDEQKAVELYTQAAAQGLVMAQFALGCMYLNGRGVLPDERKAATLFHQAALEGYAAASYNLARMYEEGKVEGLPDNGKAMQFYTQAAHQEGNREIAQDAKNALERLWNSLGQG